MPSSKFITVKNVLKHFDFIYLLIDARAPPPLEAQLSEKGEAPRNTPSASFSEGEDLFSASLNMSDADRRR